uniref:NADH-ubiquinone oxidoreductase chain 4 n=1 Tax=Partulina redfieldi TaxID=115954 RepID=A0A3S5HWT1_9EUPU|nr:NADH dehydrogenase subunit 4 [Partulina redfieldi]AZZ06750.1 NADH dehydrogenase subunit 4 [Partulina redfieldi]
MNLFFMSSLLIMMSLNWEVMVYMYIMMLVFSFMNMLNYFSFCQSDFFMLSNMSNLLVFLSISISMLCMYCMIYEKNFKFMLTMSSLMFFLMISFMNKNFFMFYLFFEASLLPTLFLIMSWGYQPERLQAGSYMMLYTVFASLPLLLGIIFFYLSYNTMNLFLLKLNGILINSISMLLLFILAFLVKLPMYSMHIWLPKAHVEAPLSGSMILAGVLLKLGGYGLYLINYIFKLYMGMFMYGLIFLSMWGGFLASMMCLQQEDMKALVAYSSVAHMSLVIMGFLLDSNWGNISAKLTMLAHGFTSSGLFMLVNLVYLGSKSRSFSISKGLLSIIPKMSLLWFILVMFNMAFPPSLNFLGELFIIPCLFNYSFILLIIYGMSLFLSVMYNMILYVSLNHGKLGCLLNCYEMSIMLKSSSKLCFFMHIFPQLLLFKLIL